MQDLPVKRAERDDISAGGLIFDGEQWLDGLEVRMGETKGTGCMYACFWCTHAMLAAVNACHHSHPAFRLRTSPKVHL